MGDWDWSWDIPEQVARGEEVEPVVQRTLRSTSGDSGPTSPAPSVRSEWIDEELIAWCYDRLGVLHMEEIAGDITETSARVEESALVAIMDRLRSPAPPSPSDEEVVREIMDNQNTDDQPWARTPDGIRARKCHAENAVEQVREAEARLRARSVDKEKI